MKLDSFSLLRVLGKGVYGKILQARHKEDGKVYAIKVYKRERISKSYIFKSLESEYKILVPLFEIPRTSPSTPSSSN